MYAATPATQISRQSRARSLELSIFRTELTLERFAADLRRCRPGTLAEREHVTAIRECEALIQRYERMLANLQ